MTDIHYDKAPILEAIIDVQVRYQAEPGLAVFADLMKSLQPRFPVAAPLSTVGVQFGFPRALAVPMHATNVVQSGFRLSTQKNDRVALIQPRGFTFSHLPPYSEWATFRDEAMAVWEQFRSVTKPDGITRISTRYINRIEIPLPTFELSDYFHLRPEIPSQGIPQMINAFFMQCQMAQPDFGNDVTAFMNMGSAGSSPVSQHILLDFDLVSMRPMAAESEAVIELLDRLRMRKNELFEACITDKVRELIK